MKIQIENDRISLDDVEKLFKKLNEQKEEEKKHLKGYMFDSLVYRYTAARQKALEYDLQAYRRTQSQWGNEACLRNEANRDVMRFIEILDEAIGERD